MKAWHLRIALGLALPLLVGVPARALSLPKTNLVNLLRDADSIVIGTVSSVTDGIDERGLPYTEITLALEETLRGPESGTYTFRQIGLKSPRLSADGTRMLLPAPEGIPRYEEGEHVLLFLYPRASITGLRSTVGLGNGKFLLGGGAADNDFHNEGVFQDVSLATGLATANDSRILGTTIGAVNPDDLLSLVRRAVQGNWTSNCQMWNTDEGRPSCGSPDPRLQPARKQTQSPKRDEVQIIR